MIVESMEIFTFFAVSMTYGFIFGFLLHFLIKILTTFLRGR